VDGELKRKLSTSSSRASARAAIWDSSGAIVCVTGSTWRFGREWWKPRHSHAMAAPHAGLRVFVSGAYWGSPLSRWSGPGSRQRGRDRRKRGTGTGLLGRSQSPFCSLAGSRRFASDAYFGAPSYLRPSLARPKVAIPTPSIAPFETVRIEPQSYRYVAFKTFTNLNSEYSGATP
jgi:hypothetical protein